MPAAAAGKTSQVLPARHLYSFFLYLRVLRVLGSPSCSSCSEVELRGDLEEPRRHDRQRIEIGGPGSRSRVAMLVHLRRIGVEQVVDVERQLGLGRAELQNLAE